MAPEPKVLQFLKRPYLPLLRWALVHPKTVFGAALLLLASALALTPLIGTEFLPTLDEGTILIQTFRIPSIALTKSLELQTRAEKLLTQFPEIVNVVSKTGRAELASDPQGVEGTDMIVSLRPRGEWNTGRTKDELVDKLREALGKLPA